MTDTVVSCAPAVATVPPMIVVTGGRTGVGTTTVAVNLAVVLADLGERVLLVDAAGQRANMSEVAGVRSTEVDHTLSDVLAGACGAAAAMTPGPAGTMLLAASSRVRRGGRECESRRDSSTWSTTDFSRRAQQRLLTELQSLRGDVDLIVIDSGSGLTSGARRFWLRSQLVVLVTTSAGSALLDSYAAIKRSAAGAIAADIRLLVNQCEDDSIAAAAHTRLSNACQRFLARTVPSLPSLPRNAVDGDDRSQPRVWETPDSPFGHAAMWLGRAVSDIVACPTTIEPAHGERFLGSCATACGALVGLDNALSTARSNTKDYVVEPAVLNQVSKL